MARFVKRRPEVEAVRWLGGPVSALPRWAGGAELGEDGGLRVPTIVGEAMCPPGWWLVHWAPGEVLVVPPAVFAATYEPAP